MHVENHHSIEELEALDLSPKDGNQYLRLRAVILALKGLTALQIVESLGGSRRAVQDWIARSTYFLTSFQSNSRPMFTRR